MIPESSHIWKPSYVVYIFCTSFEFFETERLKNWESELATQRSRSRSSPFVDDRKTYGNGACTHYTAIPRWLRHPHRFDANQDSKLPLFSAPSLIYADWVWQMSSEGGFFVIGEAKVYEVIPKPRENRAENDSIRASFCSEPRNAFAYNKLSF